LGARGYPPKSVDPYQDIAHLYDIEHDVVTSDIGLYQELAMLAGRDVLELGCGTGRVMTPLLEAGLQVTGVDTSESMLSVAKQKFDEHDVRGTLHTSDISKLWFEQEFNLIICGLDSFSHLLVGRDQESCLLGVHRALRKKGLFAIDVLNATPDILAARDGAVALLSAFSMDSGQEVKHFVSWRVDYDHQQIAVDHFYDAVDQEGAIRRWESSYQLRYFSRYELEHLLGRAGFTILNVYGDYYRTEYSANADRLLILSTREDS